MKKTICFWVVNLILWGGLMYLFSILNEETKEESFVTLTFGVLYLFFAILILYREKEKHAEDFRIKNEKWFSLAICMSFGVIFGLWYLSVEFWPLVLFGVAFTLFFNRVMGLLMLLFFSGFLALTSDTAHFFLLSVSSLSGVFGCYLGEYMKEKKYFFPLVFSVALIHTTCYALYMKEYHLTMELYPLVLQFGICFVGLALLSFPLLITFRKPKVIPWESMADKELEYINHKQNSNPDFYNKVLTRTKVAMEIAEEFQIDTQKIRYLSYLYEKEDHENDDSLEFLIVHLLDNYIQIRNFLQMQNKGKKIPPCDIVQFVFDKKEQGDFFQTKKITLEEFLRLKQLLVEKGGSL